MPMIGLMLEQDFIVAQRFSLPAEPLVEKNNFRTRGRVPQLAPTFEELRPRLPIPVLPQDLEWQGLYWTAWQSFWGALRSQTSEAGEAVGQIRQRPGPRLNMGQSALVANLAGYIPGSFSLIESLDDFYCRQHDDGFIPRGVDVTDGEETHEPYEPNSTGPNLLGWTEWRHFRLTGDKERIASVFFPLLAYHRWCRANRTWPNGLYWTTGYASGLINQPRVPDGRYHHQHWSWIDASAQAVLNCTMLERMAVLLEEEALAEELSVERERLIKVINDDMWNSEVNFYQDIDPHRVFSPVKSIASYWALLDPQLVPKDRIPLFVQHLRDTWSFRTENVVPTLSADSEAYNARTGNGWRGAVRSSLTYMVLRGLAVADQHNLAHKLALAHLEMVNQVYETTGELWESYLPEDLGPSEPASIDENGVTSAAVLPIVLEQILGLAVDWPLRQVTWRRMLNTDQEYGVRNLPLGTEGSIDLLGSNGSIRVRTDAPVTLTIHAEKEIFQIAVPSGEYDLSIK